MNKRATTAQAKINVLTAAETMRELWAEACKADGVDPKSEFVVFSEDNKAAEMYNKVAARGLRERAAARCEKNMATN